MNIFYRYHIFYCFQMDSVQDIVKRFELLSRIAAYENDVIIIIFIIIIIIINTC